jgi:hypothetical protein
MYSLLAQQFTCLLRWLFPEKKLCFIIYCFFAPTIYSMIHEPVQQTQLESYQSSGREIGTRDKPRLLWCLNHYRLETGVQEGREQDLEVR